MELIRKATTSDLNEVMEVIEDARLYLKESGSLQWNTPDGYPTSSDMLKDIQNEHLYVYIKDNKILGCAALVSGIDENYNEIEGAWGNLETPYLQIHRIAFKREARGTNAASMMMNYAKELMMNLGLSSIKGDTHKINKAMTKLFIKSGFKYCGVIKLLRTPVDNLRDAYEYEKKL